MIHRRFHDFLGLDCELLHTRGLCSMGGGGSSTNTLQKADPWAGQQGPLMQIYQGAQDLYQNHDPPQYYPGNTYAPLTDPQQGLIGGIIDNAATGGGPSLRAATGSMADLLSPGYTAGTAGAFGQGNGVLSNELDPGYLNPWNSPSFNTVVGNTLAKAIPAATSSFTNGNRTGSGLAARAASMGATDAVGDLAQKQYQANQAIQNNAVQQSMSDYLTQQGNQVKGIAFAPGLEQAYLGDLQGGLSAAGVQQTDQQNQIQAAMSRYNYGQMLPWNGLNLFEQAITGTGSPGSATNTSQPVFDNTAANVAAGVGAAASTAYGLYSSGLGSYLLSLLPAAAA